MTITKNTTVNIGLLITIVVVTFYAGVRIATIEAKVGSIKDNVQKIEEWQEQISSQLNTNKELKERITVQLNDIHSEVKEIREDERRRD